MNKINGALFLKLILLCLIFSDVSAQTAYFEKRFDIAVKDPSGNSVKQPWIGGFNACIMGEMDLNLDAKNDLVVYDQHAKKVFTFLNFATAVGQTDYRYAPEYETCFPNFTVWFQLKDFNRDGLPDLFVFDGVSGISLYKNTSQNHTVKFELYKPKLKAKIFDAYENLFCTNVDFPSFVDVDGDGDLDVLNFWVPSARNTLYYYKNHSMEKYGHADSLDFILEDDMWGCFEEHSESNRIILNVCDEMKNEFSPTQKNNFSRSTSRVPLPKHTGSTIFAADLNNDSLQDLLLADFGYPNMVALYNGGTREKAKITYLDSAFPKQSTSVDLLNCPAISTIDVDFDGVKELIFSPFVNADFSTESYASNWVYKTMSNSVMPDYQLVSKRFLQDEMLDFGMDAYPAIVDIDNDGLWDIVVGNYGQIDSAWEELGVWESRFTSTLMLLKNIGTRNEPKFQLWPLNITPKLDYSGAVPAFGDINNDGKLEMLVGTEHGEIKLYSQESPYNFVLKSENMLNQNIGTFLAPQLFDLNNDGLLDLIVGNRRTVWRDEQNRSYFKGSINYLQNIGTRENPEFTLVTDSLGHVDVCNRERSVYGYSKPCFFKDNSGNTRLFCGNEDGKILHYTHIDDHLSGEFARLDDVAYTLSSTTAMLSEGAHSAVAVADFNNDGYMDMIVGNHRGGMTLFYGTAELPTNNAVKKHNDASQLKLYPNPVHDELCVWFGGNSPAKCEIFDMQGRLVSSASIGNYGDINNCMATIDVHRFSKGAYILKMTTSNQIFTQKFVKN